MVQKLTVDAKEEGSYTVTFTFYSAVTGETVTPTAIAWSLCTTSGVVINGRNQVSITPASSVTILLDGDDLALIDASDNRARRLTIEATYDSTLGNGLHLTDEVEFQIDSLVGIPAI